jgi:alpha-D-ribose 1-methylphosphonate 5-triphosphate synthase subunit PhnI
MGYVAVKGGSEAIENAAKLLHFERIRGSSRPLQVPQIREQLSFLVDRVMGEGSLYAPDLAALAIKQSAGDTFEASFMLRAYRATQPRVGHSLQCDTTGMRVIRRISAAFKEVPGGQILGPTSDYTLRLLDFELLQDTCAGRKSFIKDLLGTIPNIDPVPESFPKIIEVLRKEGLLRDRKRSACGPVAPSDITRQSLTFPATRSAALQTLSRGETGGMLLLAYSSMRGHGDIHPTVGELRVGYVPVKISHPYTGEPYTVGEIKITEVEIIARFTDIEGMPRFTLGYGLCFGHNETKAISMAVLDRAMQAKESHTVAEDPEFVLSHIDGVESMGFCNHYKLPHYVTFQSELDRLRKVQGQKEALPLNGGEQHETV